MTDNKESRPIGTFQLAMRLLGASLVLLGFAALLAMAWWFYLQHLSITLATGFHVSAFCAVATFIAVSWSWNRVWRHPSMKASAAIGGALLALPICFFLILGIYGPLNVDGEAIFRSLFGWLAYVGAYPYVLALLTVVGAFLYASTSVPQRPS